MQALLIRAPGDEKLFEFDQVFDTFETNLLLSLVNGLNALFYYGDISTVQIIKIGQISLIL